MKRFAANTTPPKKEYEIAKLNLHPVQCGSYKKCDLHISLVKNESNQSILDQLLKSKIPYVEKLNKRIHTITTDTDDGGRKLFKGWYKIFEDFNVSGKLCMEYTVKHFRTPSDFPILPIAQEDDIDEWVKFLEK